MNSIRKDPMNNSRHSLALVSLFAALLAVFGLIPKIDLPLGVPTLHKVRPKVEFKPRRPVIPPDLFEKYAQLSFWADAAGSAAHVVTINKKKEASQ